MNHEAANRMLSHAQHAQVMELMMISGALNAGHISNFTTLTFFVLIPPIHFNRVCGADGVTYLGRVVFIS